MNDTNDLAAQLLEWSITCYRVTTHHIMSSARQSGMTLAQMSVLQHLYYHGSCDVTDICGLMQNSTAGASQLIERMVQQGYVQRSESHGDRRVRMVTLSEAGRKIILESLAIRETWASEVAQGLSAEEQQTVLRSLDILRHHMD